EAAAEFCQLHGASPTAQLCLACMSVVLRQTGDWAHCEEVCEAVRANPDASMHARSVASGMLGLIYGLRGDARRARPLLLEAARIAQHIELAAMEMLSSWGLAVVDEVDGRLDRAAERCWGMLDRWRRTEDR